MSQYKTNGGREINRVLHSANNHSSFTELDGQRYSNMPIRFLPVDYVRLEVIGLDRKQLNKDLSFIPILEEDGIIKSEYCHREGMTLKIFSPSNRMVLSGSLHKYFNKGIHNYDQFDSIKLDRSLKKLFHEFGLLPENLRIMQLEFGINIKVDFSVKELLENLIQHRGVEVQTDPNISVGLYRQILHDQYILKIYSKGGQYQLPEEVLRIEIKQTNWSKYRKLGIHTLNEFMQSDKTVFVNELFSCWDDVILFDPLAYRENEYHQYSNHQYWRDLRKSGKRMSFKRNKDLLKKFNKEHGRDVQQVVSQLMAQTIVNLQDVTNSNFRENRVCPITGCLIDDQKKSSFLLSHTGIKQLSKNNKDLFRFLKFKYLTGKWIDQPIEVQVREIAHNIRNAYFNQIRRNESFQKTNQLGMDLFN